MIKYVLLILALISVHANACSPLRHDPSVKREWYVIQSFNSADHIVRGLVLSTKERSGREDADPNIEYQYSTIKVLEIFKGGNLSTIETRSPITCCLCGQSLDIGNEYIFYLGNTEGGSYELSSTAKPPEASSLDLEVFSQIAAGAIKPLEAKEFQYIKVIEQPRFE